MQILNTIEELKHWRRTIHSPLGFVPTMGALHDGHLSLVNLAKSDCDHVIVSIFVNPKQFGPNEDLSKYPRPIEKDLDLLRSVGVDAVFIPTPDIIYPSGFSTDVEETKLSQGLCGTYRPGHFKGVTTVVLKLFNLVQPTHAYFGQKDATPHQTWPHSSRKRRTCYELSQCFSHTR